MNTEYKREWLGESGYCNCLLVTMCRAHIPALEINSNKNVPDLELLLAHRPETAAWIRAQDFHYSSIDAGAVIKSLSGSAGISRLPWGKKEGSINVHDVEGDNGLVVQRVFRLKTSRQGPATNLRIELNNTAEPAGGAYVSPAAGDPSAHP